MTRLHPDDEHLLSGFHGARGLVHACAVVMNSRGEPSAASCPRHAPFASGREAAAVPALPDGAAAVLSGGR